MSERRPGRVVGMLAVAALLLAADATPGADAPEGDGPAADALPAPDVILLHGLGRSAASMRRVERALGQHGYTVHNVDYPSRDAPIEELVLPIAEEIERCCSDPGVPVHFVAHSLGGILVRMLLETHRPANLGRVVMLAPPNQGSEWVDRLRDHAVFALAGPAASELGTEPDSLPNRLGPVDYDLGVLIGNESWNPIGSWLIPGEDDGMVGVESARVEGMVDFRVVAVDHTFILLSDDVLAEVLYFLEKGRFSDPPE